MLALLLLAQADPGVSPLGGPNSMFFLIAIFFAIFYFMIIRPQQKQQKSLELYIAGLKKGDEVVTTGGLWGKIDKVADPYVFLDVGSGGVKLKVLKSQVVSPPPAPAAPAADKGEAKTDSKPDAADKDKK